MVDHPCKCGGIFNIFGGEQLQRGLWIHHLAFCYKCETFLHSDWTQDYKKGVEYLNEQMIDRIKKFNKEGQYGKEKNGDALPI